MTVLPINLLKSWALLLGAFALVLSSFQPALAASTSAAKIQFVVGNVSATSADGKKRMLSKGDHLFEGDTVQSGNNGAAQIIYRDRSRMAVRVNTTFKIETYEYDSKDASKGSSVFSLLSGALRAVTGLIGKVNKERVTINTPLATIGIRGTDHEVVHIVQQVDSLAKAGTYNKVYLGATELITSVGRLNVDLRQTGFVGGTPGNVAKPVKLPDLPPAIKTQIIEKVPVQARRTPSTGGGATTARSAPAGTNKQPATGAIRTPGSTTGSRTTLTNTLTKSVDGSLSTTTEKTLEPSLSTTTLKALEPSLSTDTTLKTLDPSLSTSTTLKTLDPSLTTDSTATRLSTDTTILNTTKTLEPVLSEPILSEPIKTIEPVISEPLISEPILAEPIKTIEPVISEPVLSEPVLTEPIKSIDSTTTKSLTLDPNTTILRK